MKKTVVLIILILFMSAFTALSSAALIIITDIKGPDKNAEKAVYKEVYVYAPEKSIISNIKDSKKYVRFNYAVEVGQMQEFAVLKKNEQMVTDIVINIMRNTNEDAFKQDDIQDELKEKIKEQITQSMNIETIISVYVTELVIQ